MRVIINCTSNYSTKSSSPSWWQAFCPESTVCQRRWSIHPSSIIHHPSSIIHHPSSSSSSSSCYSRDIYPQPNVHHHPISRSVTPTTFYPWKNHLRHWSVPWRFNVLGDAGDSSSCRVFKSTEWLMTNLPRLFTIFVAPKVRCLNLYPRKKI